MSTHGARHSPPVREALAALSLVSFVVAGAAPSRAAADDACRTDVRLIEAGSPCDVSIVPLNVGLGYVAVMDATGAGHGAVLGAELVTLTWRSLFVGVAQIRLALYTPDAGRGGLGADFFVGTAAGYVVHLDAAREHQLIFGGAVGWGAVGSGLGGRPSGDGGLVVAPFVRYAFLGFLGVEAQALLPVTGEIGDHYPGGLAISVIGVPLLALGALGG